MGKGRGQKHIWYKFRGQGGIGINFASLRYSYVIRAVWSKVFFQVIIIKVKCIVKMKGGCTASPSSKFFKQGQTIVAKGRGLLNQLAKPQATTPPHKQSLPPARSPLNARLFVTNIPKIDLFGKSNRIVLTNERVGQINQKLQLDAQASKGLERRLKNDDTYLEYTYNPLTFEANLQPKQEATVLPDSQKRTLLAELQRIRDEGNDIKNLKKRMSKITPPTDMDIFGRWQKSSELHQKSLPKTIPKQDQKLQVKSPHRARKEESGLQWLDNLLNLKEDSYFQERKKQPKNVFILLKDPHHPDFQTNKHVLQQLKFDFDSLIASSSSQGKKMQNNLALQLSSHARQIMINPKSVRQEEASIDLVIDSACLQLVDLMLIASSRLNQHNLEDYFNKDIQARADDEQINSLTLETERVVMRRPNTTDRADNCLSMTNGKEEVEYYMTSQQTDAHMQQLKLSQQFRNKLKQLLEEELLTISHGIIDKRVLGKVRRAMDQILLEMVDCNVGQSLLNIEGKTEKKIRMSKLYKDNSENVKIKGVISTLRMKKNNEKLYNKPPSPHVTSAFI